MEPEARKPPPRRNAGERRVRRSFGPLAAALCVQLSLPEGGAQIVVARWGPLIIFGVPGMADCFAAVGASRLLRHGPPRPRAGRRKSGSLLSPKPRERKSPQRAADGAPRCGLVAALAKCIDSRVTSKRPPFMSYALIEAIRSSVVCPPNCALEPFSTRRESSITCCRVDCL